MDLWKDPKMRSAAYAAMTTMMMVMTMMIVIITNPHTKNTITCFLKFSRGVKWTCEKVPRYAPRLIGWIKWTRRPSSD